METNIWQVVARARLAAKRARYNLEHAAAWGGDGDVDAATLALHLADTELADSRREVAAALALVKATPKKIPST